MKNKHLFSLLVMMLSIVICFGITSCGDNEEESPSIDVSVKKLLGRWNVPARGLNIYGPNEWRDSKGNLHSDGTLPDAPTPFYSMGINYVEFTDLATNGGYILKATYDDGHVENFTWRLNGKHLEGSLIEGEILQASWATNDFKNPFIEVTYTHENMPSDVKYYSYTISKQRVSLYDLKGTFKGTNDTWEFYFYFREDGKGSGEGYSRTDSEYRWEFTYNLIEGNVGVVECKGVSSFIGFDGEVKSETNFNTTFNVYEGKWGKTTMTGGPYTNVVYEKIN